ncbi:unnamed protein product [Prorocentrum cordatum]|uniref:Uncharacterized protein n=1 Tax=Prorocentrum cordatum TaxID=2364126 RepID=A0ABN9VEC5_9DINO|nr:unnamed protein product [Polarella glacialis]
MTSTATHTSATMTSKTTTGSTATMTSATMTSSTFTGSTVTMTITTATSTITLIFVTMTSTTTLTITTATSTTPSTIMTSTATASITSTITTITTTTLFGVTTGLTTQKGITTLLWSVRASMEFVSSGTQEQVESAASAALAEHYEVPLSIVTVTARELTSLNTARELSSLNSWTVYYTIVADEDTIDRVFDSATELFDGTDDSLAALLTTALATEGIENDGHVQVTYGQPEKLVVPTSTLDLVTTTTGEANAYLVVVVGTLVSVILVLCGLALCFMRYSKLRKNQQRAQEERHDIILSMDVPESSLSEDGPLERGLARGNDHGVDMGPRLIGRTPRRCGPVPSSARSRSPRSPLSV